MTVKGKELARITVLDFDYNIIFDELVKPQNEVIDYLTQFSGIDEQKLKKVTQNLKEVQNKLKTFIFEQTIIVGHSFENDLLAMEVVHDQVIDTSIMFSSS